MTLSRVEVSRYIHTHSRLLLNIGAQNNRARGWLNVDNFPTIGTVYLDATKMRVLATGSFDAVLCEHMIEHVPKPTGLAICREILRILKPGGVARFVTPDIQRMCRLITDPTNEERRYVELTRRYLGRPNLSDVDAVNDIFRNYGHQYIYGREELKLTLLAAGFATTTFTAASEFANPIFENAQGHSRLLGAELNNLQAFGLEAEKRIT